eukprot:CAMPEP_0202090640 /NCGR_PEP_ID=MMETSP0964-20121228/44061_1 /ASSEMBLY_ACC=CAM_ASM_000500 /TAXON_ID=4773 /ORGANISM="Schizochytrium aggregatum, Strain ATCC28209" /LENGTH=39 /DNA_ID= /DNA_START= /DNA_END= /DNA_ORIENTATION=
MQACSLGKRLRVHRARLVISCSTCPPLRKLHVLTRVELR